MTLLTTHPSTITFGDIIINVVVWVSVFAIFRNRKKSETTGNLWRYVSTFLVILVATLGINFTKDKLKDWWNK